MSRRRPLILAHRGASVAARDNTIAAYRLAVDQGADGIECDARLTADEVVVMHHDPVVDGLGALDGYPFAAIRQVDPSIPTLDETLAALPEPEFILNVEIKNDSDEPGFDPENRLATAVARWAAAHKLHHRIVVTSFNRAAIEAVRAEDAQIPTGLILGRQRLGPLLRGLAAEGHTWVLPHHSRLLFGARRRVAAAQELGLLVGTWTLDTRWRLEQVRDAGIDAVIVDDPGAAVETLR